MTLRHTKAGDAPATTADPKLLLMKILGFLGSTASRITPIHDRIFHPHEKIRFSALKRMRESFTYAALKRTE